MTDTSGTTNTIALLNEKIGRLIQNRNYWRAQALLLKSQPRLPGKKIWQPEVERWRSIVAIYFKPEDVDLAMAIIRCESVGDHWAVSGKEWIGLPPPGYDGSKETRASGLFQQVPAFWAGRARAAGFENASIFDPVANIAVAAWMVYDSWDKAGAPHWHHWTGTHVGVQGCLEWARTQLIT